jgi:hypothetical protein
MRVNFRNLGTMKKMKRMKKIDRNGYRVLRKAILFEGLFYVLAIVGSLCIIGLSILAASLRSSNLYWKQVSMMIYSQWKNEMLSEGLFDDKFFEVPGQTSGQKELPGLQKDGKYRDKKSAKSHSPSHKRTQKK